MERSSGAAPPRQPGGSGEPEASGGDNGQLLSVRIEPGDHGVSVISLAGELDLSTVPTVENPLLRELRGHPAVVLDLTALSFIDSSGIGLLIKAFRNGENPGGGQLHTVIARDSQIERVFRLAGIDRCLPLYLDREAAVEATNGKQPG